MMRKTLVGFLVVACGIVFSGAAARAEDQGGQDAAAQGMAQPETQQARPAAQRGNRQPTAEEVRQMMQGVMGPMMGEMMSSMLKSMSKTLAEPQIAQNFAAFTRNYYQALIDRGFTADEALKIVSSVGLPSAGGNK